MTHKLAWGHEMETRYWLGAQRPIALADLPLASIHEFVTVMQYLRDGRMSSDPRA